MDEPRRQRLSVLCLDEPCRKAWAQPEATGTLRIDVSNGGGSYPAAFRVGGYQASTLSALKEKLVQYPPGSSFRWCPQANNPFDSFSPGQREEMYQQLKPLLTARSMTIEPYWEEKCHSAGN